MTYLWRLTTTWPAVETTFVFLLSLSKLTVTIWMKLYIPAMSLTAMLQTRKLVEIFLRTSWATHVCLALTLFELAQFIMRADIRRVYECLKNMALLCLCLVYNNSQISNAVFLLPEAYILIVGIKEKLCHYERWIKVQHHYQVLKRPISLSCLPILLTKLNWG